jgi:outer membrane autotransporter protein
LRRQLLVAAALGAALAAGLYGARADDVDITASTNNGIVLDGFAGTTAKVFPGVTVTDTTFTNNCATFSSICATTKAWTLTNQGTIGPASFGDGVHFTAGGAVTNSGNISGDNGIWIVGGTSGSVTNQPGATIHGTNGAIVIDDFSATTVGTVNNSGTITSDGQAVGLNGGGTLTNFATGVIVGHGGSNAVSLIQGASRTVNNYGLIQSNDSGFGTGVALQSGTLTNFAGGQILGAFNGIWANGSGATSITNAGLVEASIAQGGGSAIEVDAGGTVVNSGTIRSNTTNATTTDSGINFTGAGSITNSGTIQSLSGGRAILFNGAATHTLTLDTGSILGGNVQGGTGTDNLILKGSGTESIGKFLSFETLSMQGTDWSLTGTGAFTTSADVQSGALRVNGTLTTPTLTILSGGTVGGTGTIVGTINNAAGGTISPGNSIGTLHVTGNVNFAAGSFYRVEANPAGQSDLTIATGTVAISGGTVQVVAASGSYSAGTIFTILTSQTANGRTGTFSGVTVNSPFLTPMLTYDPQNVYLTLVGNTEMFSEIAQTRNQRAVAGAVGNLPIGNSILDALLLLDVPNALRAFDLLSGEIHASITGTLLDESRYIRDAVTGRLRQFAGGPASVFAPQFALLTYAADDGGASDLDGAALAYGDDKRSRPSNGLARALTPKASPTTSGRVITAWGQAFGNWGRTASDGNAAALDRSTGGFFTGMDTTLAGAQSDTWRFGFAGGYQHTSVNVGDRSSSGGIDTYHVAAYAGTQQGPLGVRLGSAYGWHDISTSRSIVFPGLSDATRAGYGARSAQVFGEAGYGLSYRQFALEPFAGLAHVNLRTARFAETGGAAALAGFGGSADTTFSTIGLRGAAPLPWGETIGLVGKVTVGWRHAFGTVTPTAQLAFASSGTPFVVAGVPIARDAAAVELGLDGRLWRNTTLGVAYSGQLAGNARDHGISARFVQRF